MAKTKDEVLIIGSDGRQFRSRRTWAQKHVRRNEARWEGDTCRFFTAAEIAERSKPVVPVPPDPRLLHRARLAVRDIRPSDIVYDGNYSTFIRYPQRDARARTGRLRDLYPSIARA